MLKLEQIKTIFEVTALVGILVFASPTLAAVLHLPGGEQFSELWVLGPGQMAQDYPFNVKANTTYSLYVGVGNHMSSMAYYVVYVKLRNETDALPNATAGTPSPLPQLYEYRIFLQEGKNWTAPLTFSFNGVSFSDNQSTVDDIAINDATLNVAKSSLWDAENNGYYYQLLLELWIYDVDAQMFTYNNRFVSLWLNMTSSST